MEEGTITYLSQLLAYSENLKLEIGNIMGKCAFCGRKGMMYELKLKDTFTQSEFLHGTDLICPECKNLYEEEKYRKNAWICTPNIYKKLGRNDVISTILQLSNKDIPYAIYTTDSYKKQGWLTILCNLNYDLENIIIAWDMIKFFTTRSKIIEFKKKVDFLRELEITKNEILTGEIKMKNLKKLDNELKVLNELNELKKNIVWKWVVAYSK